MLQGRSLIACICLALGSMGLAACAGGVHNHPWHWIRSSPGMEGLDETALASVLKDIRAGVYPNIHSLLVARNDKLLLEEYFTGEDEHRGKPVGIVHFDKDTLHDCRSITKSVISMLLGIAMSQGKIKSLDDSIYDFFPEYADLRARERSAITLRHVLTMTSGWQWDEDNHPYGDPANSETAMDHAPDRYRYVLERPIVHPPGETFQYNGGSVLLVAAIIERATGEKIDRFAERELFRPLGIRRFQWFRYADGEPIAASGLRLLPRDIAKLALLYLHQGSWNGTSLVPSSWVTVSTTPPRAGSFYGYFWWLGSSPAGPLITAVGYGGQRALISPNQKLVVVITAGLYNDRQQAAVVNKILDRCRGAVLH
jgi:CubicO group peptidase (beta-lactamase class C family)